MKNLWLSITVLSLFLELGKMKRKSIWELDCNENFFIIVKPTPFPASNVKATEITDVWTHLILDPFHKLIAITNLT